MRLTPCASTRAVPWEFDLDNGITVRLGRRQIDERFARFVAAGVGQIAAHASDISYIDMRYTNGFAIGWRQGGQRVAAGAPEDDNSDGLLTYGKRPDKNLIIGLDVGTSKVSALVGEVAPDNSIEVIGIGTQPSRGLKKGVVVNIESTVQSIQRAIEEAELMAGCEIRSVFAGIAGSHVRSLNSHGVVAIRDREVSRRDVQHVVDAAKAVAIPADQKILHVLPQEFIIDGQEGIRDPIGMSGVRLEAKVHIVTGAESAAQNIEKCIQRCGLEVDDIVLEQLASSFACLTDDERSSASASSTSAVAPRTSRCSRRGPFATRRFSDRGDQVTNDIASRCARRRSTPRTSRCATPARCRSSPIPTRASRCPRSAIGPRAGSRARRSAEVVEPRYEEIFALAREELRRSGFEEIIASGSSHGRQRKDGRRHRARRGSVPRAGALGQPQHIKGLSTWSAIRSIRPARPAAVRARQRARGQSAAGRSPAMRAPWPSA
jgi:cell division protein FtsA